MSILHKGRPVFISFFPFYLPSLYILVTSIIIANYKSDIVDLVGYQMGNITYYSVFCLLMLVPSLWFAIKKLNLKYFALPLLGFVLSIFLKHFNFKIDIKSSVEHLWIYSNFELVVFICYSILSIIYTELYRRSHLYELHDKLIRTSAGVFVKRERIMPMCKINDIATVQSRLGKLFNYGSVIPLSASGMGMGFNFASVSAGGRMKMFRSPYLTMSVTGGHAIMVPKFRTHEALIGINDYKKTLDVLLSGINNDFLENDKYD